MPDLSPLDRRVPTRALLVCAAFAAIQVLLFVAVVPFTTALAPIAPPIYAVVAGLHSLMPFLARLVTGVRWAATLTAVLTGVLVSAVTAIGPLILIPMALAGASFDAVLWRRQEGRMPRTRRVLAAAAVAAAVLFLVSLPVFSSEHVTPFVLTAALVGRLVGELVAAALALLLARSLFRAGVGRTAA